MQIIDHDLKVFLVLAKYLNISKTSDHLAIQQSGLSKTLKRLEERLNQKLFFRKKTGLELTTYGVALKQSLTELQTYWDVHLRDRVSNDAELSGIFRVGAHPSVAMNVIPQMIATLKKDFPSIELEMTFSRSAEINRKVLNHEIDLGFVMNPARLPDLVIRPILKEGVRLWCSNRFEKVDTEDLLFFNPEMIGIDQIVSQSKAKQKIAIPNYDVIAATLQKTSAVGILPDLVASRFADLAPFGKLIYTAELCIVYRKDRFGNLKYKALVDRVIQLFLKSK